MRLLPALLALTATAATVAVLWPRRAEARVLLPSGGSTSASVTNGDPDVLSPYFRWSEFAVSSAAARAGFSFALPDSVRADVKRLHDQVLYPLRVAVGRPVRITSGYRSPAVNALVDGSGTSDHMTGRAADVNVDGLTGEQAAAKILALGLPFDQLIWYGYTNHVHVGLRPSGNRREVLFIPTKGAKSVRGRVPRG